MCDGEPIAMHLEVSRLAVNNGDHQIDLNGLCAWMRLTMRGTTAPSKLSQQRRLAPMMGRAQPWLLWRIVEDVNLLQKQHGESEAPPQGWSHDLMRSSSQERRPDINSNTPRMDFTDVGVRHTILNSVQLHHFIDVSPSAAAIAKEARLCVIAFVAGWITTRVVASLCDRSQKSCDHCNSDCSQKSSNFE